MARGTLGFALFLLVNAITFLQPASVFPELGGVPIYLIAILACGVLSLPCLLERLRPAALLAQPINLCVVGLLAAVMFSHGSYLGGAYQAVYDFAKVGLYYLLFVSLVNTPARLRTYLSWLLALAVVLAVLGLLHFHGVIHLAGLELADVVQTQVDEGTGEKLVLRRLISTGIYNDPNDLALILVSALAISLYRLTQPAAGARRLLWLAPLGLFGYAFGLTQSRGGLIGLAVGLLVLLRSRFRGWKSAVLILAALPALLLLFAGRQTDLSLSDPEDSGLGRLQLWEEGLDLFRQSPVLGIGMGQYAEEVGQVAHNSFVHCYVELGFGGGTLFLSAFLLALLGLRRLGRQPLPALDPDWPRLRSYVLAIVAAYAAGILMLSRSYVVPTYAVLGLATSYLTLSAARLPAPVMRLSGRLVLGLTAAGVAFLVLTQVWVRVLKG